MFFIVKKSKPILKFFIIFAMLTSFFSFLYAEKTSNFGIIAHGGYTYIPSENQKTMAVYLSVFNNSDEDIYIEKISSEISKTSMIHSTEYENDIVKMIMLENIEIKANTSFFFQPGNTHIMLMNLVKKVKDSDRFKLTLHLKNKDDLETNIIVVKPNIDNTKKKFK